MFCPALYSARDHDHPVTHEGVGLGDGTDGHVFRIVLLEEVETSFPDFEGFEKVRVLGAEGGEEGVSRVAVLNVLDRHVFELVDDRVHANASEAISGPTEAVGEVDGHAGNEEQRGIRCRFVLWLTTRSKLGREKRRNVLFALVFSKQPVTVGSVGEAWLGGNQTSQN